MSVYKELIAKLDNDSRSFRSPQYALDWVVSVRLSREDFKTWEEDRAAALAWLKKSKPRRIFTLVEKALTMIPCYYGRDQYDTCWKGSLFSSDSARGQATFDTLEEIRKYCKLNIWQTYWIVCFIFGMFKSYKHFDIAYILFFNQFQMADIVTTTQELANEILKLKEMSK